MSAHYSAAWNPAIFVLSVAIASIFLPLNVLAAERGGLVSDNHGGEIFLVAGSRKSRPPTKRRKPSNSQVETIAAGDGSHSPGLASKTIVRGSLGLFLGTNSTLIFGGGVNFPLAKSVVFDGGGDYVSFGGEYLSISLMRFTGGAAYVFDLSPDFVFRAGGRAGLARTAITSRFPSIFGEESSAYSASKISFYAEGRIALEKALDALTISGEVQIPVILGDGVADTSSLSIYGGLGFIL